MLCVWLHRGGLTVELSNVKFLVNEDRTRSFAALCVSSPGDSMQSLVAHIDEAVTAFGGPRYYTVSFALVFLSHPPKS